MWTSGKYNWLDPLCGLWVVSCDIGGQLWAELLFVHLGNVVVENPRLVALCYQMCVATHRFEVV